MVLYIIMSSFFAYPISLNQLNHVVEPYTIQSTMMDEIYSAFASFFPKLTTGFSYRTAGVLVSSAAEDASFPLQVG
jgi:hypothetical protein